MTIHNIEITVEKGRQLAKATSVITKLIAKEGKLAILRLSYGTMHLISKNYQTCGQCWGEPKKFR